MTPAVPTADPLPAGAQTVPDEEIRVYGHSNLFYWWPVWALGFLFAGLTYLGDNRMYVGPAGTQQKDAVVDGRPVVAPVPPDGQEVRPAGGMRDAEGRPTGLLVSSDGKYGVIFVAALLLVIVVTNFIFRGLVSVLVVAAVAIVILVVNLAGWWDDVVAWYDVLDVRVNAGGYLAVAVPLLVIWLFSTFVYDHYTYVIVARGQVRIRKEVGEGEVAVDAKGLLLTKQRDDLFRHWLLGLGTGDLHIKTGGPANLDFDLHNVLFIGTKLARIQNLLREQEVSHQAAPAPAA
ncbi:MAG: hypothetical protein C0501_06875 [Isosphaera sp.]|nr:hypothetical protein [Isosphaera sp.]